MRVPQFDRFTRGLQALGFMIVGAIVGSAVYHSVFHYNFNMLFTENVRLQSQLDDYRKEIDSLSKYKDKQRIYKLRIRLEEEEGKELDEITRDQLKKRLFDDLDIFVGRNIYEIDSDAKLARELLNRKIYPITQDKDFVIGIKTMLLVDGVLQIWVKAKPYLKN